MPNETHLDMLLSDKHFEAYRKITFQLVPGIKASQDAIKRAFEKEPLGMVSRAGYCPSSKGITKVALNCRSRDHENDYTRDMPELILNILSLCGDKEVRKAIEEQPDVFRDDMEKIVGLLKQYKMVVNSLSYVSS